MKDNELSDRVNRTIVDFMSRPRDESYPDALVKFIMSLERAENDARRQGCNSGRTLDS